jgi:hypothetical protein
VIGAHIDDIFIIAKNQAIIKDIKAKLAQTLEISDLGPIKLFLGIDISRNRQERSITLSQKGYIKKIIDKFAPNVKKSANPCQMGHRLEPNPEKATPEDIHQYQQQIGSLMYLMTATRPDLAYPIGLLARFMSNPSAMHQRALNRIWQYIAYSANFQLTYKPDSSSDILSGYCDSDWGGDFGTRKSTTGYIFLYKNSPISWSSKLQKTVALSSCEAEYMALKEAIKEQIYLKSLFSQIPILKNQYSNRLYTDSQSAIELAKNPVHHNRTKHIDIQYHFVRQAYINGLSSLTYISTDNQLADALTKAVDNSKWSRFIQDIGINSL